MEIERRATVTVIGAEYADLATGSGGPWRNATLKVRIDEPLPPPTSFWHILLPKLELVCTDPALFGDVLPGDVFDLTVTLTKAADRHVC